MELYEAVDRYLDERDGNTRALSKLVLTYFSQWFAQTNGEVLTLGNWTTRDIREYRSYLLHAKRNRRGGNLSPATVNTYLRILSSFCSWCVDNRFMERNPVPKKVGIGVQHGEVTVLDRNQENRLLRLLESGDPVQRFVILFIANTGLRNGEMAALTLRDVWLGEKGETLDRLPEKIPESRAFRTGMVIVRDAKGHKYREVDLNAEARQVLLDYLKVRPHIDSDQLLVSVRRRAPMTRWGIIEIHRKYEALLGTRLHAHLLRHQFGTKITASSSIEVAADLLGHSNVNTTRAYYVHGDAGARRNAVDIIGEM